VSERPQPGHGPPAGNEPHPGHEPRLGNQLRLGNEFAEIVIERVDTRNGARVVISAPRSGRSVSLCPLELEALTWQNTETFSAMIGKPFEPLIADEEGDR
jgi:hypothetical protein